MIKVVNKRKTGGSLFHYAHFLCDCLFPEIVCDIFNYKEVVREKNIDQTIGNFSIIYEEVMMIKNTELLSNEFNKLEVETNRYNFKEEYFDKKNVDKFRFFIFSRYKINNLEYETSYPEVLLIKRGSRVNLIDDEYLKKINNNTTTGKERREIKNIEYVEKMLDTIYQTKCKSLYFEDVPFEEQVKYFNNAKLIVCAHGAVMSNMFFCKEGTKIIEVVCGGKWIFFDEISKILKLKHVKCCKNELPEITNCINMNKI